MVIHMTKEDMQQIRAIIREELAPIKEDIETLKEDMSDAVGKINMISEWCEAASEYHIHEIHYPLESDEKVR